VRAAVARVASLGRKRVLLLDGSRAETLAAYGAADLFVFASNIEASPIVLYVAAAAGTPFLTADVGNAAEIAAWTGGGDPLPTERLADGLSVVETGVLAERATELLRDPDRRGRLAATGRAAFEREFSWATIARRYEAVYAGEPLDRS
jgi:glycosyltransferase involved in cell wall biosynthesis